MLIIAVDAEPLKGAICARRRRATCVQPLGCATSAKRCAVVHAAMLISAINAANRRAAQMGVLAFITVTFVRTTSVTTAALPKRAHAAR